MPFANSALRSTSVSELETIAFIFTGNVTSRAEGEVSNIIGYISSINLVSDDKLSIRRISSTPQKLVYNRIGQRYIKH